MSQKGTVTGKWANGKNKIGCRLPLIEFEDGNNVIAYCPALDLSRYGPTAAEAERSFKVTLSEYFRYTMNKGTLAEDLKKLGWKIKKSLDKKPVPLFIIKNNLRTMGLTIDDLQDYLNPKKQK
ncbi:MAG: hypothetical protein MUO72_02650 [Bacteroidales bacterium]|nr:hypothetical protein [Bacteroidales bacterium]